MIYLLFRAIRAADIGCPAAPSLQPKKTNKPHAPWVVNLPPSLSSTGRRERRYFDKPKPAEEFCRQQRIRLENYGRLKGTGATLIEAVEHFLDWQRQRASSIQFGLLMERFLEAKKQRRSSYQVQLRNAKNRFFPLNEKLAIEITSDEIDDIASLAAPYTRNGFLRVLRAAFNWGIRKGWCVENPIKRLDFTEENRDTKLFTNEQVSALVNASVEKDRGVLPYCLFTLFAGIRPEEAARISWDNVNFDEDFIEIPEKDSKTELRRIVEMEPLLVRWLNYYRAVGGDTDGRVAVPNLRKRLRAVRRLAGIERVAFRCAAPDLRSCWL